MESSDPADRFVECWRSDAPRLMLYARRHVGADDASDIVAETFTIAWRRWVDVPDPPIGWLIATARKVIQNHRRRFMRRDSLARRLELLAQTASRQDDPASVGLERQEALERLAALKEAHREALLLIGWDGLTATEAAEASGLKPSAFRTRLHRARQELESTDLLQDVIGKETS